MGVHREEARFTIRIELSSEFDEDYEGDDDGYEWLERWNRSVRPRLVAAVFEAVRAVGFGQEHLRHTADGNPIDHVVAV